MKAKKWLTIITLIITALSLVLAFIIGKNSNCITYDISMAIFGGAALGFIMSLTEYYVERRKAMEEFWLQATKVLNELKKIKYLDVDAPINLIVDAIHEDDSNALKEKFHLLSNDEKISVNAKENLISWYKENIPIPFDENTDDNKELTHLYDSNMAGYKEVFLQCMDSYREASMVELGNLDNAYGNLDFIIANKCIRQKAYEQIYDKLRKIVYQFRNEVYHFNLLKDGNGNFPVCILKVSELNQKYFLSKEKNLQGYTNVSIFQNVFDDIDASLEKFRCKIYRIEYVEPKAIPVSGKTFFNNNESRIRILKFGNGVCVTAKQKLLSGY